MGAASAPPATGTCCAIQTMPSATTIRRDGTMNNIDLPRNGYLCRPEESNANGIGESAIRRYAFLYLKAENNPTRNVMPATMDSENPAGLSKVRKKARTNH